MVAEMSGKMNQRSGFTFVEVIACLLILAMGMMGAIALVISGLSRADEAQAQATALGTAMSVAVDPDPLLPAGGTWTSSKGAASGYINGYFVKRTEVDGGTQVDGASPKGFATRLVRVDVYQAMGGRLVASQTQRVLRVAP